MDELKRNICKICGAVYIFGYDSNSELCCSENCERTYRNRSSYNKRQKKLRDHKKYDSSISLKGVVRKYKNMCQICGGKINWEDCSRNNNSDFVAGDKYPSVDHITPINQGGTHTWDNVQLAHRKCNQEKDKEE